LAGAEVRLGQRRDELNDDERAYIEAGVALRETSLRQSEEQRIANERLQRLFRRFIRLTAAASTVFLVLGGFHLWIKENNSAATWDMGWTALCMRTWLLFHKPPEPEMVPISGGKFTMGAPAREGDKTERPQHEVRVSKLEIGKYDVTFAEYDVFTAATMREKASDRGWGREKRPVINVSWTDATAYIEWLNEKTGENYRLPSEAEWEYAARAGTTTSFWWGRDMGKGDTRAHCDGCGSQWDGRKPPLLVILNRTLGVCTTRRAMSGNGRRTAGTERIKRRRRTARLGLMQMVATAIVAWFEEVRGPVPRRKPAIWLGFSMVACRPSTSAVLRAVNVPQYGAKGAHLSHPYLM
jgi:hypothetical protein